MEQRESAGITIRLVIDLVRRELGEDGVRELLALAGETRPLEVLENPRIWHSVATRQRLFDAGSRLTGDPDFALRVGASALSSRATVLLRVLFRRFGSPRNLLRALPVAHSKFDTSTEARLVVASDRRAVVEFRTKPPYEPVAHDCKYAMGLFSQLPAVFGMAPATVTESQCQARGATHCLFDVRWEPRRRARHQRSAGEPVVGADVVELQLEQLEATVSDLLDARDVDTVLTRVVEHVGSTVAAQQVLLAIRLERGREPAVRASGLPDDRARAIALAVLDTDRAIDDELVDRDCPIRIVSEVRSAERHYGRLVAFSNAPFIEGEQQLLDAYARLAATALDATVALEVAAGRQRTAEVLGAFAARLIRIQDTSEVAVATVEAAQEIVAADQALLLRYGDDGALRCVAHRGYASALGAALDTLVVTKEDTPEVLELVSDPEVPRIYDRGSADAYVAQMMDAFGTGRLAVTTLRTTERLYGVLIAAWEEGREPAEVDELARRLAGVADQAAGAWEKALLIEQVHRQASVDALTGCANRRVFTEVLAGLLAGGGPRLAVLFCDLDQFKGVNDALGHAAGDELLVEVARRLERCVRPGDLVARLGGDEFTVLLTAVDEDWDPEVFAGRVRAAMVEPVELDGSQVVVHLSIGAVVAEPGRSSVKDVLRQADAAMYAAKSRGGDRILRFEETMLQARSERLDLEAALARAAVEPGQFELAYQPQVDLVTGEVLGAEALVRWCHPTRGLLAPGSFLPVAEETGLVVPLDLHVLRTALAQVAAWRDAGLEIRVSVNLSARTLAAPELLASLRCELAAAGVPSSLFEIELTESTAVADPEALTRTLLEIGRLGVSVAIDDVGTGFSSLALLHQLPAQRIKIDRSFVQRICDDPSSRSVVEAVLLLADRLGREVVAEGIETVEQALEMVGLGCRIGQGYLFARPGTASELAAHAEGGILAGQAPGG
ncbi:MAG TPA: EAL domain-containing protein [Acidimicrobiales bacterium]|nr:EAL domain-containing protein [Acidimicrobiales bacterium]